MYCCMDLENPSWKEILDTTIVGTHYVENTHSSSSEDCLVVQCKHLI